MREVRYGITLIELIEVLNRWALVRHHLISSSSQGGYEVVDAEVRRAVRIQHRLRRR